MQSKICGNLIILVFVAMMSLGFCDEAVMTIAESTGKTVSPLLIGMNAIYNRETREMWQDGRKVEILKKAGVRGLRYPGGHVVSFWDWEFPYHEPYQNFWDSEYVKGLTPEKKAALKARHANRMTLEDYFRICAQGGCEPIVGINLFQGYKFDSTEESIAKAVRLVERCKKQNLKVTYYYLDNEAGHQPEKGNHIPVDAYIKLIPAYSKAIKAVQPDAKIIVNTIGSKGAKEMIESAGRHFDILDYHWYYNSGEWGAFMVSSWRKDVKHAQFRGFARNFDQWTKQSGNTHVRLGLLEWNLGPATGQNNSDKGTALWQGLVQADMLMTFVDQGVSMAACWPLTWSLPGGRQDGFRDFVDATTIEASPSKHVFNWFSKAAEGSVLKSSITGDGILAIAVMAKDGKRVLVYLLNKEPKEQKIRLVFAKNVTSASGQFFGKGTTAGDVLVAALPTRASDKTVAFEAPDTTLIFMEVSLTE